MISKFMCCHVFLGAIEISILSKHYQTEIDVVNTESGRIDRFGKLHDYKYTDEIITLASVGYHPKTMVRAAWQNM